MKLTEYIQQQFKAMQVEIPISLVEAEMESLEVYDANINQKNKQQAKEVIHSMIPMLLLRPSSISEGGFSISYNKEALLNYYSILSKELGKEDVLSNEPTITDITNQW